MRSPRSMVKAHGPHYIAKPVVRGAGLAAKQAVAIRGIPVPGSALRYAGQRGKGAERGAISTMRFCPALRPARHPPATRWTAWLPEWRERARDIRPNTARCAGPRIQLGTNGK